ncbi:polyprenyl diphosphate synthase [Candidatus Bathyarchaeota archaeon]|jgi:tritrans,polycis-undecaprenyl-diphosphate synthase [geranylgeranyl-diphosphate specific]|nr:polyprenyl diphosphate synthase [Candidatus Bathyarchaeota archaeon]
MLRGFLRAIGAYAVYEKWLDRQVRKRPIPEHLGVILDGNRRWAIARSGIEYEGHRIGAKTSQDFLEWCLDLRIKTITLYAFSIENFNRPKREVDTILSIIEEEGKRLLKDQRLHQNQIRVKALGRVDLLPKSLQEILREIEDATESYDKNYLNIALAYGGRTEIIDAARKIARDVGEGSVKPEEIDEQFFMKYLYTAHLPNPYPDLIIRTSGEERLSGFLLWQSAYSEFCFLDVYWPEFRRIDLFRAVRTYQQRKRRYGQ